MTDDDPSWCGGARAGEGEEMAHVNGRGADDRENGERVSVLHITDKFSIDGRSIHGVARLLSWWVRVMDRERYEMSVMGLAGRSPAGRYVEEQGPRVFYSDRGKMNPMTILDIVRAARETGAGILHLHGYRASTFGRIAGLLLGVPVIVHEHAVLPDVPSYQKLADRALAPLDRRVLVNCRAVADFCVEHRGMRPGEIEVVFNGIPLDEFRDVPVNEARKAAEELALDWDAPVVGTVARLDEQKGVTHLLQAVPGIRAEVPDVQVLIVGDGTLRGQLEHEAAELGVDDATLFAGERRDVPRLYELMDVKVISSIYEGTTLTVFEAMAAGTPVVATSVDGVAEVIEDGKSGVLVEPEDPRAIAEAVVRLLQDPDSSRQIVAQAEDRVLEYDVRTSVDRIEEIYGEVLVP